MSRKAEKLNPVEDQDDRASEPKKGGKLMASLLVGGAMLATGYFLSKAGKKKIPLLPRPEAEVIELGRS